MSGVYKVVCDGLNSRTQQTEAIGASHLERCHKDMCDRLNHVTEQRRQEARSQVVNEPTEPPTLLRPTTAEYSITTPFESSPAE